MLTYNRPQLIGRAIQSVVDQRFREWELLVVQDGENERTQSVMAEWRKRDDRICYLPRGTVGNIAEASNHGIRRARGEFLAILDDDDSWATPEKLEKQVAYLDRNPGCVGCGGGVIVVDQDGMEKMRYLRPERHEDIRRGALYTNPMGHSTTVARMAAVMECGGYDETLAGYQDWDLWLKLGLRGKLYNFPEYFLCYTVWEGGGSFQQQAKNTRSALRIAWRHRRDYPGFFGGFSLWLLQHLYAHLPAPVKKASYAFLSRSKKAALSQKPG